MRADHAAMTRSMLDEYLVESVRPRPSLFTARRIRGPITHASAPDDPAMRRVVVAIWAVAAALFAVLGLLVR